MSHGLRRERTGGTSYLTGGEGPTLVFLHGIPGSALTWAPVAGRLADAYHVVVPDLRGFGQSEPADDYYLEGQAQAVRDLLDTLDIDSFSLVTHDFGGPVGLTMLRLFPDLEMRGLVVSDTNLFTDTYVPPPLRVAGVPVLGRLVFTAMVGNRLGLRLLHRAATKRRDTVPWSAFQRHLTPSGITTTRRIFQRSLADLEGNYGPIERSLPEVAVPTLVLWGDSDPFFGVDVGERTAAALDGMLTVYERTGHFVPEERPAAVAAAIREFCEQAAADGYQGSSFSPST
ncbi:alpha/beta fold hydrolase [Haloglomus litoreum]|uniref:alpha/beta fold hydrolase n=1 Tax=Haloglomus litoreum TaxID=3034026 RepID=UPI0023E8B79F|nr:alpha/beta hydrolase [Haloglomus sp. DT116]